MAQYVHGVCAKCLFVKTEFSRTTLINIKTFLTEKFVRVIINDLRSLEVRQKFQDSRWKGISRSLF